MFIRSVKALVLGTALLVMSAAPAFAQGSDAIGNIAVGLSFLGDEGGTGIQAAVSNRIKSLANDKVLSWLVDASFHHKGSGLLDTSVNHILAQGGAQVSGTLNEKAQWYAHGMIGILRTSIGGDLADLCDLVDESCSDTSLIVTPGGGIAYALNDKTSAYAQLDIPIGSDGNTTRFTIGVRFKR